MKKGLPKHGVLIVWLIFTAQYDRGHLYSKLRRNNNRFKKIK